MENSNMYFTIFFHVLAVAHHSYAVDSAREYCLAPMNVSDCGLRPTPVYSYYKPGSICIIAMWKGCPTKNKFHHIDQCSSLCQGSPPGQRNRCDVPLDTNYCTNHGTPVFTYDLKKQTCVEAMWFGCSPLNKFNDKQSCVDACHNSNTRVEWTDKIKNMDIYFIKGLYAVLDEVTKSNITGNTKTINENVFKDDNEIDNDVYKTFKRTPKTIKYPFIDVHENSPTDKDDVMGVGNNYVDTN